MMHRPVSDLLVKPAGPDCNLDCEYCFYTGKQHLYSGKQARMSAAVLEKMIPQLMEQPAAQVSVGWQGGEPTLMGLDFYQRAVDLMQAHGRGQAVANALQTNGLLIDRRWARFLRKYQFLVGLSIDGPEHIHNHYRKDHSGRGSWRRSMDAAHLLLDQGVQVNVLTVVNSHSVQFPEEIYSFHKEHGLTYMQFIPCVETSPTVPAVLAPFTVPAAGYGKFLCSLFDSWLADFSNGKPVTSIRFFEALLFKYAGLPPTECTLLEECGTYLVVEHNGDVYPCDFFVEPGWKLGNLMETRLETLLNSSRQQEFRRLKSDLPQDCQTCQWKFLCRAGCTKDRLPDPLGRGAVGGGKNHLCEAYQVFFPYAHDRFKQLANKWKEEQKNDQVH